MLNALVAISMWSLGRPAPQVTVQEAPFGKAAVNQREAILLEVRIGLGQGARRKARNDAEEEVHELENDCGAPSLKAMFGLSEVGQEPGASGSDIGGDFADEFFLLGWGKAIEKEMCDGCIVRT